MKFVRQSRKFLKLGALEVRMASDVVGAMYTDAENVMKASVTAVSPPNLICKALDFDKDTLILKAGCQATYSIHKNVKVVAFGKAVLGMVAAVESLMHNHVIGGVASVPVGAMETSRRFYPHHLPSPDSRVRIYEGAAGNVPDGDAATAAQEILSLASACGPDDLLIALVSGGGSALLPCPAYGITLEEKRQVINSLARSGATIHEVNAVRKAISRVKGGRLALAAYPAKVLGLIISDVVGNDIETIASGPTVPQMVNMTAAKEIIEKFTKKENCKIPASVTSYLSSATHPREMTNVGLDSDAYNILIGSNKTAVAAAKEEAMKMGYASYNWSLQLEGEARKLGEAYALMSYYLNAKHVLSETDLSSLSTQLRVDLESLVRDNRRLENDVLNLLRTMEMVDIKEGAPFCLIGAGEPTVTVKGRGKGGRNQELVLAYAIKLRELMSTYQILPENEGQGRGVYRSSVFVSFGTDGQDGDCDAAGAMVDDSSLQGAKLQGLDSDKYLSDNDSYTFFSHLNSGRNLIKLGLTGTNVMDLHLLLIK